MKLKTYFYSIMMSALFLSGCEKVDLGRSFDSVVNDKIWVNSSLAFSIDSIRDYRCPSDVMCIWAGDVDIYIKFFKTFSQVDTMMNLTNSDRNPISVGGYTFTVNDVNPVPVSYEVIPQKDYKINMTITRN